MNLNTRKVIYLVSIAIFSIIALNPLFAQVYKTVDADGNVSYTDRPPAEGAKPVVLAPISVIEVPVYAGKAISNKAANEEAEPSLRDMRRNYRDFAIVAPRADESVWQSNAVINVAWSARYKLQPGMTVTISVNGQEYVTTTQRMIPVEGLERGAHTITAELKDLKNRKIATAKPVSFYVRQPNIYSNRQTPSPRG